MKEELLVQLLEREQKLEENKLKLFQPNPGKGQMGFQEKFIRSLARIRIVTVGNQEGKTHVGAWDHACLAMGVHPYRKIPIPNIGFVVTAKPHSEGIEKDILPKLKEVTGSKDILEIKNNTRGTPYKIIWSSGSVSFLLSAEQEDIVFEGTTIDHAWLDEPSRREIFIGLRRGLMKSRGPISYTCTPLSEPWMYEELYLPGIWGKDKEIEVIEGTGDENFRISGESRAEFLKHLTPDEIETRRYGRFRHLSGRVFKTYDPARHRIVPFDIPPHWPVWIGIDPHRNKPHAVLFLAVSPEGIKYVCNEIYLKCTIGELGKYILDVGSQYKVVERLIDTSAQEDGWGRVSARELLELEGCRTKLAQKKNLKASGILLINQLFQEDKLFVFESCVRTHRELTLQIYRKSRDSSMVLEEPEKKNDEMSDGLRYVLNERPDYSGIAKIYDPGPLY